ncbi:ERF family protein [Romboutsia sp.]|uniref:ERF family protein n=1 Tax=Romboutsia sp. TaxID=1965302 RepID=UPI002BAA4CC6|nr:ERF family protein [Romboutsia sp.]HSQ88730.1 ERF family protein [Romboutsia sp.]
MESKNIYTKLMEVRVKFHGLELKKSGLNKFAGFKYYELGDFLVPATSLLKEFNLCPMINFTNEMATMTVINGDNPSEQIQFTSPMRELTLKGTNDIQNLGGIQTYLTRYLYIQLLNIVESDSFDAISGKAEKIYREAKKSGISKDAVDSAIKKTFNKGIEDLTDEEYKRVFDGYKAKAEAEKK